VACHQQSGCLPDDHPGREPDVELLDGRVRDVGGLRGRNDLHGPVHAAMGGVASALARCFPVCAGVAPVAGGVVSIQACDAAVQEGGVQVVRHVCGTAGAGNRPEVTSFRCSVS
jgi:hypothetical protein